MKTILIALMLFAASVVGAAEDMDGAAIFAALPSATRIVRAPYGYRVNTPQGMRFVNRAPYGYRITGAQRTVYLNRTRDGFRVESGR